MERSVTTILKEIAFSCTSAIQPAIAVDTGTDTDVDRSELIAIMNLIDTKVKQIKELAENDKGRSSEIG